MTCKYSVLALKEQSSILLRKILKDYREEIKVVCFTWTSANLYQFFDKIHFIEEETDNYEACIVTEFFHH